MLLGLRPEVTWSQSDVLEMVSLAVPSIFRDVPQAQATQAREEDAKEREARTSAVFGNEILTLWKGMGFSIYSPQNPKRGPLKLIVIHVYIYIYMCVYIIYVYYIHTPRRTPENLYAS